MKTKLPAVFLDRDGTICRERDYLRTIEDIDILPGVPEAIRLANEAGLKVVIISNQSGVARGYFTEATVREINEALLAELKGHGADIAGSYYCPHHIDGIAPYNIECDCRKPAPGMLFQAANDLDLDISRSAVIGDKYTDVQTGLRLNIPGILVLTGYGRQEMENGKAVWEQPPTHIAQNLYDAIIWWIEQN